MATSSTMAEAVKLAGAMVGGGLALGGGAIGAAVGDAVNVGQPLVWLEAMKMEHTITAPTDGVLVELNVQAGQQVEVGTVLARLEMPAAPEA